MIKIEEVTVGFNQTANYIQLKQGGYILGSNEECKVRCLFFKDLNLINDSQVVVIPRDLVISWGINDKPLIDYVVDELGLVIIEEIEL